MTIQHSIITDPHIHEPKGASTATSGQVWSANGAGSGAFSNSILNCHGQIAIEKNTTAKTLVAAVDSTLNTDTDYQKLTGASAPWINKVTHNITFSTDKVIVPFSGYYFLSFWCSIKIASINNFIAIKFAINDTIPYSSQKVVTQSSTANDVRNLSAMSIIGPLTANDSISLYIAGTIGTNVIMQDAGLMIGFLHA